MTSPSDPRRAAATFNTTHWSEVARAGDSRAPGAAAALEHLCQTYWYPLYAFVRRKGHGHEDACDLTQAFFAKFLGTQSLQSADAARGRFRTFLLASLTHFLANEWDKSQAQRRGGGCRILSLDEMAAEGRYQHEPADHTPPEKLFDRRWAQTVMRVALDRLRAETKPDRFDVLKGFLLDERGAVSYEDAATQLGLSVPAVTSAIHRMRGRLRLLLHAEVAQTLDSPRDVESELRHLLSALAE